LPDTTPGRELDAAQHRAGPLALSVLAIRDSLKDTLARKSAAQLVQLYEKGEGGRV
jgi:hypothetical protein